jgi:hypothetical protein
MKVLAWQACSGAEHAQHGVDMACFPTLLYRVVMEPSHIHCTSECRVLMYSLVLDRLATHLQHPLAAVC